MSGKIKAIKLRYAHASALVVLL